MAESNVQDPRTVPSPPRKQTPDVVSSYQPKQSHGPLVVGLYGLPGAGKTYMLDQLKQTLPQGDFAFYEGSEVIDGLVPGGLDTFRQLNLEQQDHYRETAIDSIQKECAARNVVGVVAGHFMFWDEGVSAGASVCTPRDLAVYTHMLYLEVPAEVMAQRRDMDVTRDRPKCSVAHLREWQAHERAELVRLCRDHGILFSVLTAGPATLLRGTAMLRDFKQHTEHHNMTLAMRRLDDAVIHTKKQLQTILMLDADRTLAPQDTGTMFWEELERTGSKLDCQDPLKSLFSSPLGYTYTAFRQATLLYEDATNDSEFDAVCESIASQVVVSPEFEYLLQRAARSEHVGAVVVTCGLCRVWHKVLERLGLSSSIQVIGGGRLTDGLVVNDIVKGALAQRLRRTHNLHVWAFGDSPLDLRMLTEANEAVIVVGDESNRSSTMNTALRAAIEDCDLEVRQTLIPRTVSPRLDTNIIPLVELMDVEFLQSMFCNRGVQQTQLSIVHATNKKAASLLMTPMRDAATCGPALREAHQRAGQYLALEYLPEMIGVEEYATPHVQGHTTSGFRVFEEHCTLIVALMRGGEPMALGVSSILPSAPFLHASRPGDVTVQHLRGIRTIILVDSVINTGSTVIEFVKHIRAMLEGAHIVIVAGVVQADFVSPNSPIHKLAKNVDLVALRLSKNKFKGKGGTDTGNRLFNTTMLG